MSNTEVHLKMLNPFSEFDEVKKLWNELENTCPHSFFLSWAWMETWLKTLSVNEKVVFICGIKNQKAVFAYFTGLKTGIDNRITIAKRGFLNSTGNPEQDEITIEYNGILFNQSTGADFLRDIFQPEVSLWDELVCPAVLPQLLDVFITNNRYVNARVERKSLSYFVELDKVRDNNNDLISLLSKNKRSQIRQSIRCYEQDSVLTIKIAANVEEALSTFQKLKELNRSHWQNKGKASAFSSPFFCEFHENLISNHFDNNLHLVTISCGEQLLGYLYNFVYQNKVLFYQCGFEYHENNQFRPGLLSHYLAINYYAEEKYDSYDFLAGDGIYKKSLSTDSVELQWIRIQKKRLRFKLEDIIRVFKSSLSKQ